MRQLKKIKRTQHIYSTILKSFVTLKKGGIVDDASNEK